jgi:hypothetical protein
LILLDNEPIAVPKFISAQKLLEDKFILEFANNNKNKTNKIKKIRIELNLGDIACFVKPRSDFVCDTIVRGILPKRHNGLESPTVYVLVTDNKFDFYNITEIADKKYRILDRSIKKYHSKKSFHNISIGSFLNNRFRKRYNKKYKSKLVVITGDFFLTDPQIKKEDKDWLYPQMLQAMKKIAADTITLVFSPTTLSNLVNYE